MFPYNPSTNFANHNERATKLQISSTNPITMKQKLRMNIDAIRSKNRCTCPMRTNIKPSAYQMDATEMRQKIDKYRNSVQGNIAYLQNRLHSKPMAEWGSNYSRAAAKLAEVNQLLTETDPFDDSGINASQVSAVAGKSSRSVPDLSEQRFDYMTSRSEIIFSCCPCTCPNEMNNVQVQTANTFKQRVDNQGNVVYRLPIDVKAEVLSNEMRMLNSSQYLLSEDVVLRHKMTINKSDLRAMLGKNPICQFCAATLAELTDALDYCNCTDARNPNNMASDSYETECPCCTCSPKNSAQKQRRSVPCLLDLDPPPLRRPCPSCAETCVCRNMSRSVGPDVATNQETKATAVNARNTKGKKGKEKGKTGKSGGKKKHKAKEFGGRKDKKNIFHANGSRSSRLITPPSTPHTMIYMTQPSKIYEPSQSICNAPSCCRSGAIPCNAPVYFNRTMLQAECPRKTRSMTCINNRRRNFDMTSNLQACVPASYGCCSNYYNI